MQLFTEQVAAAQACGIAFTPASPAQVQRLSMQRKVFRVDGRPHLATRDGSLFETAATLARLIEAHRDQEEEQRRDLAAWQASGTGADGPVAPPPEPAEETEPPLMSAEALPAPPAPVEARPTSQAIPPASPAAAAGEPPAGAAATPARRRRRPDGHAG